MELSDLQAFVMLAETLSFTRSAEAMFVSQSTFSRQISRLEAELGVPLFVRSPRAVSLTDYGRVFLEDARAQLGSWERSLHRMERVRQGTMGHITVGFIQDNPNDRFPEILRAYRQACPQVDILLQEYGQGAITRAIETGVVDVGFTFSEGLYETDRIETRILDSTPICVVLRKDHPLCERQSIRLRELAGEPLVLISQDVSIYGYQNVLDRCRRGGITPEISATARIVPSLFMLIEAGMGFAFLPGSARRTAPEGVSFLELEDCEDVLDTVLAWRSDNENPALRTFLQAADSVCGEAAI